VFLGQFSASHEELCRHHSHAGLQASPQDIIASVDMVSLFTRMPVREALILLARHFEEDIVRLLCHFLTYAMVSSEKRLTVSVLRRD
jgi:hypothetical protein